MMFSEAASSSTRVRFKLSEEDEAVMAAASTTSPSDTNNSTSSDSGSASRGAMAPQVKLMAPMGATDGGVGVGGVPSEQEEPASRQLSVLSFTSSESHVRHILIHYFEQFFKVTGSLLCP